MTGFTKRQTTSVRRVANERRVKASLGWVTSVDGAAVAIITVEWFNDAAEISIDKLAASPRFTWTGCRTFAVLNTGCTALGLHVADPVSAWISTVGWATQIAFTSGTAEITT